MQESLGKKVHPGLKIAKYQEESLGYGLYIRDGSIYASVFGHIASHLVNQYFVSNNFTNKKIGLQIGDIVIAKVIRVKEEEATLQIMQVNQICCLVKDGKALEGTIKK